MSPAAPVIPGDPVLFWLAVGFGALAVVLAFVFILVAVVRGLLEAVDGDGPPDDHGGEP